MLVLRNMKEWLSNSASLIPLVPTPAWRERAECKPVVLWGLRTGSCPAHHPGLLSSRQRSLCSEVCWDGARTRLGWNTEGRCHPEANRNEQSCYSQYLGEKDPGVKDRFSSSLSHVCHGHFLCLVFVPSEGSWGATAHAIATHWGQCERWKNEAT